jgi:hypothetical protein
VRSVSRALQRFRRAAVDLAFADRPRWTAVVLGGLFAALWLLLVAWLGGFIERPSGEGRGPIVAAVPGEGAPRIARWQAELALTQGGQARLPDLSRLARQESDWLNSNVCRAGLATPEARAAGAWRIRNNPLLCGPTERRLAQFPLAISLGAVLGIPLSILIVLAAAWAGLGRLILMIRVGMAYRWLYASKHREDRGAAETP